MHLSFSKVGSNSPLLNNGAMIDQEKSTQLKVLKPKLKLDADEGVARGNGASPLDQRGEPLEDPLHLGPEVGGRPHQRLQQLLHLLPQDQEASRVLGEAQSRVSYRDGGVIWSPNWMIYVIFVWISLVFIYISHPRYSREI